MNIESAQLTKIEKTFVDVFCRERPCPRHQAVERALDMPTFYSACELVRSCCSRCPLNGADEIDFDGMTAPSDPRITRH